MTQEPQQSSLYAEYMKHLHWTVETIDGVQIFLKSFPFGQGMAKIHRPESLPDTHKLKQVLQAHGISSVVVEPVAHQEEKQLHTWVQTVAKDFRIHTTPFLPTKTIRVDISRPEETIFQSFSEAKRRAVRKAIKLGVTVSQSDSMTDLIKIKNKSAGWFGFITTTGMKPLWDVFHKRNAASIVLAYSAEQTLIGGVLLLHWNHISYYWIAGSTKYGKKLYAPTLLAWEAMKVSKANKSKQFDFVGVWDERIPKKNTEWKGFTKFKEGFGGSTLYYPLISLS